MTKEQFINEILKINGQKDSSVWYDYYDTYITVDTDYGFVKGFFFGILYSAEFRGIIDESRCHYLSDVLLDILHHYHPYFAK